MGQRQNKKPLIVLEEIKNEFEEFLTETLNDIFSETGTFSQTDELKYCEYCPYKGICGRE